MAYPNKRLKLDFSEITILVGKEEQKFTLHKSFIKTSKMLMKCCDGPCKESDANTIRLPQVGQKAFTIYQQWLYTNEVISVDDHGVDVYQAVISTKEGRDVAHGYHTMLYKLAVLGHQLDDACFRNKVNDEMLSVTHRLNWLPSPCLTKKICQNLPKSSLFRKLFVEMYATMTRPENIDNLKEDHFPAEFMFELIMVLMRDRIAPEKLTWPSIINNRCKYHEHEEHESRCTPI